MEQIDIFIESGPTLVRFVTDDEQREALKNRLSDYLRNLTADLALPAEISLEFKLAENPELLTLNPYRIILNGERCRTAFPIKIAEDVSAEELALSMARVIYQNPEYCITLVLCEKLCQQSEQGEHAERLSALDLQQLYRRLVRSGFSIARAFTATATNQPNVDYLFEESIGNAGSLAIVMYTGRVIYDKLSGTHTDAVEETTTESNAFQGLSQMAQNTLFNELGVIAPEIKVRLDESLRNDEMSLQLNDLRFPPARIMGDEDASMAAIVQLLWDFMVSKAGAWLIRDSVEYLLDILSKTFPALIETTLARFDVRQITGILRSLVEEGISIKDLRSVLEGLTAINGITHFSYAEALIPTTANFYPVIDGRAVTKVEDLEADDLANGVRMSLKLYMFYKYVEQYKEGYALCAYLLDAQLMERLKSVGTQPLSDEEYSQLMLAIHNALTLLPSTVSKPIILTAISLRKSLRKQIEKEFPSLIVVSPTEFPSNLKFEKIGTISLAPASSSLT